MKSKAIKKRVKKPIDRQSHIITEGGSWFVPAADMHETEKALVFKIDMPGCTEKDITLDLKGDELVLTGHLIYDEEKDESILYTEFDVGHYHRHFNLSGPYDLEKIDANMSDGVLTISVPKLKQFVPKKIKVKAAA